MESWKYSQLSIDLSVDFVPEKLECKGVKTDVPFLNTGLYRFYQSLKAQEDVLIKVMIIEDHLTYSAAKERFKQIDQLILPMMSVISLPNFRCNTDRAYHPLALDQFIVYLFGAIACQTKLYVNNELLSLKNSLVNKWVRDFPFIGNYLSTESQQMQQSLLQQKWTVLVDDTTDLDGLLELLFQAGVLKRQVMQAVSVEVVAPAHLQFMLENKGAQLVGATNRSMANDKNADVLEGSPETFHLTFVEEIASGSLIVDWTNGNCALPELDYIKIINGFKA